MDVPSIQTYVPGDFENTPDFYNVMMTKKTSEVK